MPDIFLSYNREDQATARLYAQSFEVAGFEVWWDVTLRSGEAFDEVTEKALAEAKAVVVLWSPRSAASRWVRSEATQADRMGTLMPVTIEACKRPIMFELTQTADLAHWSGEAEDPAWLTFLADVRALVGRAGGLNVAATPRPEALPVASANPSIAVSPFADPTGAGDDFANGLAAEIATALARFETLNVVDAGPASTARYLLEGSVQRSGARVRINLQLREGAHGGRVWAERFDGALADPFALQDDVATKAAGRVEAAVLTNETRRIASRPPESLSAHELWLRARETIRRAGLEQVDEIEALSERAVALDAGHARALAMLAVALGFRIAYSGAGADAAAFDARFDDLVRRAMFAGADDAEVLVWVGEALLLAERDMVVARALLDRALQTNPGLVVAWDISANIRLQGGEYEDALARYERFLELDPISPWRTYVWPSMAGCMVALGRFDEAIVLAKEGLQIGPGNPWAVGILVAALAHSGRIDEARAVLAQLDPRQAGVFKTSQFGPRLTKLIEEALELAGWTVSPVSAGDVDAR